MASFPRQRVFQVSALALVLAFTLPPLWHSGTGAELHPSPAFTPDGTIRLKLLVD